MSLHTASKVKVLLVALALIAALLIGMAAGNPGAAQESSEAALSSTSIIEPLPR